MFQRDHPEEAEALRLLDEPRRRAKRYAAPPCPTSVQYVVQGLGADPAPPEQHRRGRRATPPPYATWAPYVIQGAPPAPPPEPPPRREKKATPPPYATLAPFVIHGAAGGQHPQPPDERRSGKRMTPPPHPSLAPFVIHGPAAAPAGVQVGRAPLSCLWARPGPRQPDDDPDHRRPSTPGPGPGPVFSSARADAGTDAVPVGGARPKTALPLGRRKARHQDAADDKENNSDEDSSYESSVELTSSWSSLGAPAPVSVAGTAEARWYVCRMAARWRCMSGGSERSSGATSTAMDPAAPAWSTSSAAPRAAVRRGV
ncbi:hypothetical protein KUF71_015072 [Frankliniella fusca]|uniref:Uncharacterized protein n=1 Tax=Frankliniella fusca TaxID=407009 RepID=A0AAE1LNF3_9NEOP|nr:hypothetical protein KUF71_015072 [Frankliniella fusca]